MGIREVIDSLSFWRGNSILAQVQYRKRVSFDNLVYNHGSDGTLRLYSCKPPSCIQKSDKLRDYAVITRRAQASHCGAILRLP